MGGGEGQLVEYWFLEARYKTRSASPHSIRNLTVSAIRNPLLGVGGVGEACNEAVGGDGGHLLHGVETCRGGGSERKPEGDRGGGVVHRAAHLAVTVE